MKKLIMIAVVVLFAILGMTIKNKYTRQKKIIQEIIDFFEFYKSNIFLCKNSLSEIIDKFINNNKNGLFCNLIQKNGIFIQFNAEIANLYFYDNELKTLLQNLFLLIGKQNREVEIQRIDAVIRELSLYKEKTEEDIKAKGDLYFKICIGIGLVVAILIW